MLVVHGIYSVKRKIVAYRNDFCLSCEAPRRAYRIRSFDVVHLFFVLVLPLGFWRHWRCSVCARNPHTHPHTRRSFKWAGVVILAIFAAAAWVPGVGKEDSSANAWMMRIGLPIAFVAALWLTLKSKPDLALGEKLREITPAQDSLCPLCKGVVVLGPRSRCSNRGVERTTLRA